jgi:hypothetical protein
MQTRGDIPEKDEVEPEQSGSKVGLVNELLEAGSVAHLYLRNLPEGDDIHCYPYNTHVYPEFGDNGLIYTQVHEEDKWICPEESTLTERHYE